MLNLKAFWNMMIEKSNTEKYVDREFVEGLLNMFDSTGGDQNMVSQIFDNILNDEKDMSDFMEVLDDNKYKIVETIVQREKYKNYK